MIFWNTTELAVQIKAGTITEETKKNYYLAASIISTLFIYLNIASGPYEPMIYTTDCLLTILVIYLGINYNFQSNGGSHGRDYISRAVMLGLPLVVKLITFSFVAGIVIAFLADMAGMLDTALVDWIVSIVSVVAQAVVFWRISEHLKFIGKTDEGMDI